jgi:hypothetical protein
MSVAQTFQKQKENFTILQNSIYSLAASSIPMGCKMIQMPGASISLFAFFHHPQFL